MLTTRADAPDNETAVQIAPEEMATTLDEVYKSRTPTKKVRAFWGWLAFLVFTAFMVWFQSTLQHDSGLLTTYNWVRGISFGLIYLLVVVVAFEDHLWQGLLVLVFPPYCLYYALIRLDTYLLRNLFLAMVVSTVAEMHFIPEHALITHAQNGVNEFIRTVEGMIQSAGDAPTFE
jgi:hypothetical protein